MRLIAKVIRISHAFHCQRLTTVQDIQDYASLIFGTQCISLSLFSVAYTAPKALCFCLVRRGFCPVFRPVPYIISFALQEYCTDFDEICRR